MMYNIIAAYTSWHKNTNLMFGSKVKTPYKMPTAY